MRAQCGKMRNTLLESQKEVILKDLNYDLGKF